MSCEREDGWGEFDESTLDDGIPDDVCYFTNPAYPTDADTLRILAIGNSYTEDATTYLDSLVIHAGIDPQRVCLYQAVTASATFETWVNIYTSDSSVTLTRRVGKVKMLEHGTLQELLRQPWNVIVVQQASNQSYVWSSYLYLKPFVELITSNCLNPQACLAFQLVWSHTQSEMPYVLQGNIACCQKMIRRYGIDVIIPTGTAIQLARSTTLNAPLYMTRDRWHLHQGIACYIASCTWFQTLFTPVFSTSVLGNPAVPIGKLDTENLEVKKVGTPRKFDFEPRDHVQLMEELDLIDFERGTKVSGQKFYYLKNEAVFLEQALIMYTLNVLRKHGFTPFITPDVAKQEILQGIGFNPRGNESNVYCIEDEGTCLVATAEITLGGYHSEEILDKSKLPLFYCGLSHCFRREAGAAGQFSKGLYRVHQFDKVEMFVYCAPEDSDKIHEQLRLIEEEIFTGLGLPFHVVDTCTGDLGAPAYRKWDLEAWMPGRNGGEYGEVTSTSNCTDYQSRRLNVRFKDDDGKNKYVHMLNGTAIAVGRAMLAIFENYQNEDGSITVPEVLVPLCGFDKIGPKKK
mgnify:CR=1 FL=1